MGPKKTTPTGTNGNGTDGGAKPTLSVEAVGPGALESDTDPMVFRISRANDNLAAVPLNFTLTGTASAGSDFTAPGSRRFVIPSGQASIDIKIPLVNDSVVEPEETLIFTLDTVPSGYISTSSATMLIEDDDGAVVSIEAPDASVSESGDTGTIRVKRSGMDNSAPLAVKIEVSGTATANTDYKFNNQTVPSFITIPAGADQVDVTVNPLQDDIEEGTETIVVKAKADAGYSVFAGLVTPPLLP